MSRFTFVYDPCRCVWMSPDSDTHTNESLSAYERGISFIWMSHDKIYERVMSHIPLRHVPYTNESCPTYKWAMLQILMCRDRDKHRNESSSTYGWGMSPSSFIFATWLIHMRDMTHSYVCHDSFICVTWLIHMCDTNMNDDVAHVNESRRTYEWDMSHIRMSHVEHMNESCHTYDWVMLHIRMSQVTHKKESCRTYEWDMYGVATCSRLLQMVGLFCRISSLL